MITNWNETKAKKVLEALLNTNILEAIHLDDTDRNAIAYAINALEERPTREWIPITERLPKDDEDILVTYIGEAGLSFIGIAWFDEIDNTFVSQDNKFKLSNVVAWMPLLEPYKESDV